MCRCRSGAVGQVFQCVGGDVAGVVEAAAMSQRAKTVDVKWTTVQAYEWQSSKSFNA